MPVLTYGLDGAEGVTFRVDRTPDFRPLEGTGDTLSVSSLWGMLPSDLSELPWDDRVAVEAAWKAMLQYAAAMLAEVAHLDQASSLLSFPIRTPRKWVRLPLWNKEDVSNGSPLLLDTMTGAAGARLIQGPNLTVETVLDTAQDASSRCAHIPLRGPQTHRAAGKARFSGALRARAGSEEEVRADIPAPYVGPEVWALFGYGDAGQGRLAPGAYAGVSTDGRVAAILASPGSVKWAISGETIGDVSGNVDIEVLYEPTQAGVRVSVRAEDAAATVAAVAVEGVGEFSVKDVVVLGADTRAQVEHPHSSLLSGNRKRFSIVCRQIEWSDCSLPPQTRAIPSLQSKVSVSADRMVSGIDFLVEHDSEDGTAEIRFVDLRYALTYVGDRGSLWAENMAFDYRLLEKVFGRLVGGGLVGQGPDSLEFRNKLVAILHGLLAGPGVGSLSAALSALAGVPVAVEPGTVLSINTSSVSSEIVVRGEMEDRRYPYPSGLSPSVRVGDTVEVLQPLVDHVVVRDWLSGKEFTDRLRLNTPRARIRSEAEKFSAIHIEVPYGAVGISAEDAGDPRNFPAQVSEYLRRATALWSSVMRAFIDIILTHSDDLRLRDKVDFEALISLRSSLTNARDPRYNDSRGFVYDGTLRYNEADFDILRGRLEVEVTNTSGAPLVVHIFGTDVSVPAGGTVTEAEPL